MTITGLLLLVMFGVICGGIAELIVGWRPWGLITSAAVGFMGAFIGDWFAPRIGLPTLLAVRIEGHSIEIFWSVLGAIALLMALNVFRRTSYKRWPIL